MRNLFSGRRRYALPLLVVGASLAVMGAQCQPQGGKPAPTGLSIDPTSHDFGTNTTVPEAFTVTNNGPNTSGVINAATDGADADDFQIGANSCDDGDGTLAAGDTCVVDVTFIPLASGGTTRQADLVVNSDNPDDGEARASMTGTAE
jgi:hypothetical protein